MAFSVYGLQFERGLQLMQVLQLSSHYACKNKGAGAGQGALCFNFPLIMIENGTLFFNADSFFARGSHRS